MSETKLTEAQREQLTKLRDLRMPASMSKCGWPGFPERYVDLRTMPALLNQGLVECGQHVAPSPSSSTGMIRGVWWRITPAGRAALSEGER